MTESIMLCPLPQPLSFSADEIPLLTAQATLPCWDSRRGVRFNRYYRACADSFRRTCRHELFPRAERAYLHARENAQPIPQWQAELTATITLRREQLLSLHTDTRLTGAAQPLLSRCGDTWDLRRSLLLALSDCFPPRTPCRSLLLQYAAQQIEARQGQGIACYHDDWPHRLAAAYHPHRFYLTEEGLCFFFLPGTIAPVNQGLIVFSLPYRHDEGPFIPQP